MRPSANHVVAVHGDVAGAGLGNPAGVIVPLQSQEIDVRGVPVQPKSSLPRVPVIGCVPAVGKHRAIAIKIFAVDPVVQVGGQFAAIPHTAEAVHLGAAAPHDQKPLCVFRIPRGDVDDAVDRIGPPLCGPWPADDFNPVDVLQECVLHIPKYSRIQRRIDRASVNHHQHFVCCRVVESACADGPLARINLGHLQVRGQTQRFRNTCDAKATNVLLRYDLNGRCRFGQFFRTLGYRGHLDVHELFHAQLL